jgi:porphobilinogen deaminase
MALLGGGCDLPLGALAEVAPGADAGIALVAAVFEPDGARVVRAQARAASPGAAAAAVAALLRERGAEDILSSASAASGAGSEA